MHINNIDAYLLEEVEMLSNCNKETKCLLYSNNYNLTNTFYH